ncbi:MAG: hypothetical protein AAFO94_04545 [Bacteroidota bacterium]
MNNILNFGRLGLLLRKDIVTGYRLAGLTLLTAFVIATLAILINDEYDFHYEFFPVVILLGGFIYASVTFNELHTKDQRHVFLSLPASAFEKLLSKLLLSTLGFALVMTLSYWLYTLVINAVADGWLGIELQDFTPFEKEMWLAIKLFLVLQSVFLLGSVYFDNYAFMKTVGTLLVVALVLALITYLLANVFLAKHFEGWSFRPRNVVPSEALRSFMEGPFTKVIKFIFWYLLAPFLWVVAYFKLKEREA